MARERRVSRATVYQGRVVDLYVDQVQLPDRSRHVREVVGHKAAVAIVPLLPDGRVILIRQYRYAVGRELWELPAGLIDPGETPRQAAVRELREETGYRSRVWRPLTAVYSSPGFCREKIFLFQARQAEKAGPQELEADESLTFSVFTPAHALKMLAAGRIADAKTALGLMMTFPATPKK